MSRHVYRPPRGTFTGLFAVIGGLIATIAVFIAIPLSQKLSVMFDGNDAEPPEIVVEPPEEQDFETEEPPEEPEEEPEPEEMVEEASDLDLGIDLGDLSVGTGGGFVMEIPQFSMKGGDDAFGGDLDSPPQPTSKVPPTYPSSLLSKGVGGRVLISCTIDTDGKVIATTIKSSSGHPDLDKAAINAVNRWKFKAGTRGGKKVKSIAIVPFNFEVKKG
ncbi:energy transducer TonB [Luteolibacter algae]|uniref:Energy transducer TonB n=1 Tax=Luteolibacter algae TaxID=454151 RepID=A0ABW5D771_9BACT